MNFASTSKSSLLGAGKIKKTTTTTKGFGRSLHSTPLTIPYKCLTVK
jgi:hypothetical protein